MKMNKKKVLIIFLVMASITNSENFIAYKTFKKPHKPYKFNSPYEENKFFEETAVYKAQITKYIAEQQEAIERHKKAQEQAKEEWNEFAKYELGDLSKQFHENLNN